MDRLIKSGSTLHQEMTNWRRELHAHPETAYEEFRTSDFIAAKLQQFGLDVTRGLGGTGVIGTLQGQRGAGLSIALRADMDALNLPEANTFAHRSTYEGKMHGCGHDGHVAMLLGAAKHLASHNDFYGTVHFIFQPAEENEAGAQAMIRDGLVDKITFDAIFGLHNWPGLPLGHAAVHHGPVMAAFDTFEITITGKGCHGAMPHQGCDSIVAAGQLITALQSVVSRNVDPLAAGVISITQIEGGSSFNVLPDKVVLKGTTRSFLPEVQQTIMQRMARIVEDLCSALDVKGELAYTQRYPATVNSQRESALCAEIFAAVLGKEQVKLNEPPSMGGEDFAFFLQKKPGCYTWLGVADEEHLHPMHSPHFDFNDAALPMGCSYWIELVARYLKR